MTWELPIGARFDTTGTHFRVWAPRARSVEVVLFEDGRASTSAALAPQGDGFFAAHIAGVGPGARYMYRVDGGDPRPDPASRFQPEGVHGPSEVVDPQAYSWHDIGWRGKALEELVIYELHVGTATPAGTFEALIEGLDELKELGVTAIELMPVAAFPGRRGWGYDGVSLFAPHAAYGGPEGLRRLVDAAHARGLAVLLDVVYNHLGPDGNYLRAFSPAYFTDRHHTPWGEALNVDGPDSRPVRDFFIANTLHWAHEYHLDGLRLDATHAILDDSPTHLLAELAAAVRESLGGERRFVLIAENEENEPGIVHPAAAGGWGLDGVWADDFHHQVRVALTGEQDGYYANYSGTAADLAATLRQNWFYQGQVSPDKGAPRGAPADDLDPPHFVYCIQNHDQVGNRALGERLNHDAGLDGFRAAAALLLIAPHTPLLWMGQEWAASTPFLYFTDHNPELGRLVTEGRRKEFAHFTAFSGETVPDPQAEDTFLRSKLDRAEREREPHAGVLRLHRDLLALRRDHPAMADRSRKGYSAEPAGEGAVLLRRRAGDAALVAVVNLGGPARVRVPAGLRPILDSEDARYGGRGAARLEGDELVFEGAGAVVLEG
jgi:maltooligosyltrehalose trehalohydrolase